MGIGTWSDTITDTELGITASTASDTAAGMDIALGIGLDTMAAMESDTTAATGSDTAADVAAASTNVVAYSDAEVGASTLSMTITMDAVPARTTATDSLL
jgi:hypothetical protein